MSRTVRLAAATTIAAAAVLHVLAAPCTLQLGTRGTFREISPPPNRCLSFVDVLGNRYEVANPKGAYRDGLSGVAWAELAGSGSCTGDPAIRICLFEGDRTKRVSGTLEFRQLIECPGYVIAGSTIDYRIYNCEDFGTDLCAPGNVGRKIQAQVDTEADITICLGQLRSFVLDYRFVD